MKLLYTTLVLLLTVGVGVERSLLLVDADSIIIAAVVADQRGIDDAIDEPSSTSRIAEEEKDGDESREGGDTVVELRGTERIALLGRNGIGKTRLLDNLPCMVAGR